MAQKNKTLYESLLNFQKQLPDIAKSKTAGLGKFSYSYLPLEDLLSAIQPVLHSNGLIIIQPQAYNDHGQTCIVTRLIHVESGEEIKSELPIFLPQDMGKKEMFTWGGSLTYGRRYAIKMLLGIEPDMDTNTEDPKEITDKVKPEKKTGISRTPTKPDSHTKKVEEIKNEFMTPAAKEEIGSKISRIKNDQDKVRILSAFKQQFKISATQISPQHITLATHGQFLDHAIGNVELLPK